MLDQKFPITPEGYKALQGELANLKSVERPNIIAAIAEARAHGDLSENAEYQSAKEKQSFIEGRISELEGIESRAQIIEYLGSTNEKITFGATVELADDEEGTEKTYQIVGAYEADIEKNLISTNSPIGKALLGKEEGDVIDIVTPKGAKSYEILSVKY